MKLRVQIFTFFFLVSGYSAICGVKGTDDGGQGKSKNSSFTENKQWELRLTEKLRSTVEFRMKKPLNGANFNGNSLEFEWEPVNGKKLFLGLLNNENKEIYYKEVTGNKASITASEVNLNPGLFYWVLESEEDILTVGKLFYKKK